MPPADDRTPLEDWQVEALLAFDAALAVGGDPVSNDGPGTPLQAVHECQRLLERVWPRSAPASPALPRRFGRFLLLRELGRGGFGIVFLAADSALGRKVALKLPRPEVLVTPEVRRRFLREAEAAGRLDHPHIVPLYEVGEEGAVCYLASAYCAGITLADWLRGRTAPVPARQAAAVMAQLAGAVGHAHARGILHRDLKPGNILLQRVGAESGPGAGGADQDLFPRICDFGLAKILDQDSHDTCSGVPLGSPAYMAPEQAAGRHRELVPATDVFALGVIFYELLTGRPPFQGETVLETLKQVSDREPPPPRVLRPGLPRDLDTICRKCLEKRPDRRYAGGAELADDLGRFLAGRPVKARPVPAWVRAGKWVRRWPAHAALAAVLALGLLGVLGGLAWSGARERRYSADLLHALDRVRESERRARAQTRLATERERLTRLHWTASQTRLAQSFHDQGDVEVAREVLDGLRPEPGRDDLRGFAWHYLDRLCRSRFESSEKLSGQALSAGLSADGRTFAVGSTDGRVSLWDLQTRGIRTLAGKQRGEVRAVRFSPDGRTLASASHSATGGNVTLWDVASGEEWVGIPHDFHGVYGLVFSPDGSTLTTVDVGGPVPVAPVRVWALAPDRRRASLVASLDRDQLRAALPSVYRPPGADTAAGDEPPNAGPRRERASPPRFAPQGIAISPDGRTMAVDCGDGAFGLFHTSSAAWLALCRIVNGELFLVPVTQEKGPFGPGRGPYSETDLDRLGDQARKLTGCARARLLCTDIPVHTARLARDGRTLAVDTNNGEDILRGILRLFDTGSGRAKNTYTMGDVTGASDWSFTPDGRSLIIAGGHQARSTWGEKARVWHFEVRPEPPSPRGHAAEVWALAYSPDGRTLASSSDDHTGKPWDLATGRERMTLRGHGSLVTSIAYAPDGTLLASGSFDHTIRLWDAVSGRELAVLRGHTDKIRCIAISPDGRTLASGGDDRTVRLWDVATRRERSAPLTDHTSCVGSVVFTPDGKSLISGALDKTIRLWDWGAGRACSVRTSGDQILALALSPDGKTLASAGPQGDVVLWDREGMPRRRMRGHTLDALGLAFSPDGRTLASAGRDKTVRLWDPTTGQEQLTLKGHDNCVHAVAFSPDGSTLASGCHDGAIKLWRSRATPGQE